MIEEIFDKESSELLEDSEKQKIRFASGKIAYFGYSDLDDENADNNKRSLYFNGNYDDGQREPLKRNIKLSRYVQGYNGKTSELLFKSDYPKPDHIYLGKLQVETWKWQGHNCVRILAFEITEDLGLNPNYEKTMARNTNPFVVNENK